MQISDLGFVITGKTPTTKNADYWDGDIPFITPGDIQETKHIFKTSRLITNRGAASVKGSILPKDAVCVSCIGTLGYVGMTTQLSVSNQQINSIVVSSEHNPDYVYYLMRYLWSYFKSLEDQSTTLSILNKTQFSKIEIPKKARNEEDTIARILSKFDEKIENNNQINKNLTEQARAIFQAWFIDYEPFGGSAPIDWRLSTLGQIATIKTESWSPAKNPNVVVEHYSIPAFDKLQYPVFEIASGIKSNKYILTSDSVMISKLNPDTKRIWRPLCLSEHSICSTEFIVYEAKKQGQKDYIYSILDSVPFLNHLCSHTTGSTNSRQRATPKNTLDFALYLPPDSLIKDFCQIVTPIYDLIDSNIIENQSLAKIRDSLLPKLMSGELDVSNLDL